MRKYYYTTILEKAQLHWCEWNRSEFLRTETQICSDTSIIFCLSTVMLQGNPDISLPTTPSTSPRGRPDEKYNHYKAFWFYPRVSSQSARNTSKNRQPGIIPSRCWKKLNLESRNEMELVDHAWSQASLPERHHPHGQALGSLATWARR